MRDRRQANLYLWIAMLALILAILTKLYRGPGWVALNAWAGDVGIVICLFFLLAAIFPGLKPIVKLLIIAFIAVSVECFQGTGIPGSWNLPAPFVWVLGSQFDPRDFIFYAIGLGIAFVLDLKFYGRV